MNNNVTGPDARNDFWSLQSPAEKFRNRFPTFFQAAPTKTKVPCAPGLLTSLCYSVIDKTLYEPDNLN